MPKPYKYLLLIILITDCFFCKAQVHINCCGIDQTIPRFTSGDTNVYQHLQLIDNRQLLVNKKVLRTITSSSSELEIRISSDLLGHEMTFVLKCDSNSLLVTDYDAFSSYTNRIPKEVFSDYRSLGALDRDTTETVFYNEDVLYNEKADGLEKSKIWWNDFFKTLIKNHFFDFPSQKTLEKMAPKRKPNHDTPLAAIGGGGYYEIKVGNNYRYMLMWDKYAVPKYIQYKLNIHNLFSQFYQKGLEKYLKELKKN